MHDKNNYIIQVDKQTGINSVSATSISLLENLSDDPWFKLPSIVLGNIITSAVTNQPTLLQIGLGVTLGKKSFVQHFVILVSVAHMMNYCGISSSGCIKQKAIDRYPVIRYGSGASLADNFDANITSPNRLKSTHALALLMTQECPNTEEGQEDTTTKTQEGKCQGFFTIWYTNLLLPWPKKA